MIQGHQSRHGAARTLKEDASQWLRRTRQKQIEDEEESRTSPVARAAWRFIRGKSGIQVVDAIWASGQGNDREGGSDSVPVISLNGDSAKTWFLMTLASRFVVATCTSKFEGHTSKAATATAATAATAPPESSTLGHDDDDDGGEEEGGAPTALQPHVLFLDSTYDVSAQKMSVILGKMLSRGANGTSGNTRADLEWCSSRIHIVRANALSEWVPILEACRTSLPSNDSATNPPTLVVWDGFLSEESNAATRAEVMRQMQLLLQECSVAFVFSRTQHAASDWYEKLKPTNISLRQSGGRNFTATCPKGTMSFSTSLSGIVS